MYVWCLDTREQVATFCSPFSPCVAVSLCDVAGHAEIFPFVPVIGQSRTDLPGMQVTSDSVLRSLRIERIRCIFISATDLTFSLSLLVTCLMHSNRLLLVAIALAYTVASFNIFPFLQCLIIGSHPPLHIAHSSSLSLAFDVHLLRALAMFHSRKGGWSNHWLIHQDIRFRWKFQVRYHSSKIFPFRPCINRIFI